MSLNCLNNKQIEEIMNKTINTIVVALAAVTSISPAYDDLDTKTAAEVLKQETGQLTAYPREGFFSAETQSVLDRVESDTIKTMTKLTAAKVETDLRKLYDLLDHKFVFNPSKGACNQDRGGSTRDGYRSRDARNVDYVYFYLLTGLLDKYSPSKLPDLDTSDFACKGGPMFKAYEYDNKRSHYWKDITRVATTGKNGSNPKKGVTPGKTALGDISEDSKSEEPSQSKPAVNGTLLEKEKAERTSETDAERAYRERIEALEDAMYRKEVFKHASDMTRERKKLVKERKAVAEKLKAAERSLMAVMDEAGDTNGDLKVKDRIRFFDKASSSKKIQTAFDKKLRLYNELDAEYSMAVQKVESIDEDIDEACRELDAEQVEKLGIE